MDFGLRKGSALSPPLFIAVVEVISWKASTSDILRKLLYVDNLAVVAVGRLEGNLWQTWIKSKCREDAGALGRAAEKRYRNKTGGKETEPARQLCISKWSGLRGRQHGDGNSTFLPRVRGGKWKG